MKLNNVINGVLIFAVIVLGVRGECKNRQIEKLKNEVSTVSLQSPETLPEDVVTVAVLNKHVLSIMSRIEGDSVVVEEHYIPVESEVQYIVRQDTVAMGQLEQAQIQLAYLRENMYTEEDSIRVAELEVTLEHLRRLLYTVNYKYDTHGFCFEPEIGGGITADLAPCIQGGARLYYMRRFGIGVQAMLVFPPDTEKDQHPVQFYLGIFGDFRIPNWENVALSAAINYDFEDEQLKGSVGLNFYLR